LDRTLVDKDFEDFNEFIEGQIEEDENMFMIKDEI